MQEMWLPLVDVVERIMDATGDDGDFVRNELLKLLRAGTISGRAAGFHLIPRHDWNEASLSKMGAAVIPFGALPIHHRHQIELRYADVLRNWPELAIKPEINVPEAEEAASTNAIYKTGLPGKPTSWHLIEREFHLRWSAGERHGSLNGWGRVLAGWLFEQHPLAPKATERTIRNRLLSSLPSNTKSDL